MDSVGNMEWTVTSPRVHEKSILISALVSRPIRKLDLGIWSTVIPQNQAMFQHVTLIHQKGESLKNPTALNRLKKPAVHLG